MAFTKAVFPASADTFCCGPELAEQLVSLWLYQTSPRKVPLEDSFIIFMKIAKCASYLGLERWKGTNTSFTAFEAAGLSLEQCQYRTCHGRCSSNKVIKQLRDVD